MLQNKTEIERIKECYELRKKTVPSFLYSFFNPGNLFIVQERDREILMILKRNGIHSIRDKKILDVGCGEGGELRNLIRYGALPENLYGIDLLQDRIEQAKKISQNIDFKCGDASKLPYENEQFDIVIQFTVFTSILDIMMKQTIAKEMVRVLKPYGIIIWYDYHINNPKNPNVRGIKKREIYRLFSNCNIYLKRITLVPPLVYRLAPKSLLLCYFLERLKVFNTHYLGIIKKKA